MTSAENPHGFGEADALPIRDSYDAFVNERSIAAHFDALIEDKSAAPFNEYFDDTVLKLMRAMALPSTFTVADMACGNGKFLDRMSSEFALPKGALYGCDLSQDMVAIAKQKHPAISFEKDDIRVALPGIENAYDLVTCINAVHYLPTTNDVRKAYVNAYRLIKPGGHYIVVTGDHASTAGWRNMSYKALRAWIADGRRPMDWSMPDKNGTPVFRLHFYPYLNEEHEQALKHVGFKNIVMHRQYPPGENIAQYNPAVYDLLKHEPAFIFLVARKPA